MTAGGPGSGHFGHAGRPGEVGGSSAGGAAPLTADLVLHHSSPNPNIPSFAAFFGGADFEQGFGKHEFGEYRYEAILPKGTLVLDLNQDTPAVREFKARMVAHAFPTETDVQEQARTAPNFDVYEEWTDKANILAAMRVTDVVKYQDEYLIPKDIMYRIPVSRTLGGQGSGNFGHAGRPGEVGGSASEGAVISRRTGLPIRKAILPSGPSEDFRRTVGTTAAEMRAKGLPATIADAENRIRNEPNEHGYLATGAQVRAYYGQDHHSQIQMPKDVSFADLTFTHNHPSGTAFSSVDVALASYHNMREIRAVTTDGTFSMKRVGDHWPHVDLLDKVIQEEISNVTIYFTRRVASGMVTASEANRQHWTAIWIRVQEQLRKAGGPQIEFNFEKKAA